VCDLETSRIGAPYIYDISHLRVNIIVLLLLLLLLLLSSSLSSSSQQFYTVQKFCNHLSRPLFGRSFTLHYPNAFDAWVFCNDEWNVILTYFYVSLTLPLKMLQHPRKKRKPSNCQICPSKPNATPTKQTALWFKCPAAAAAVIQFTVPIN